MVGTCGSLRYSNNDDDGGGGDDANTRTDRFEGGGTSRLGADRWARAKSDRKVKSRELKSAATGLR